MPKLLIAVIMAVSMVLTLSACGESKAELIKELEDKANENNALLSNNQILAQELTEATQEIDIAKYERDAFLEENLELRAEMKSFEEREQSLMSTLGLIFTLTNEYREDLADIEDYVMASEDLPVFSPDIKESHKNLMYRYFTDYMENIHLKTAFMIDAEPILFIIHVDTMETEDIHRATRENCTYYKVVFYQSLVDYNGQDTTVPIPRGFSDGLITNWLVEVEEMEYGCAITLFEPNV